MATTPLRKGLRYLVLVLAVFPVAAGLRGLLAGDRDWVYTLPFVFVLIGLFLFLRQSQEEDAFLVWLKENLKAVKAGTALYNGAPVNLDTELVQFQGCVSILVWTGKFPSRLLVPGNDSLAGTAALYTVLTLLVGWWGIPHGIFWTSQALWMNLKGGTRLRVRDLLTH